MSAQALDWAMQLDGIDPVDRLVLFYFGDAADHEACLRLPGDLEWEPLPTWVGSTRAIVSSMERLATARLIFFQQVHGGDYEIELGVWGPVGDDPVKP
jgi:hypothetical protein